MPLKGGKTCKRPDFNACKEIGQQYASDVLDDFYNLAAKGFVYQPWVQFTEPLFHGKKINIVPDEIGLPTRKTLASPIDKRKPLVRIFVMGGSTTFGYNVSDEHTWPTYLSQLLNERVRHEKLPFNIEVVNYGKGYYTPSQETILLIDLLKNGHRPSLVVFMDGINSIKKNYSAGDVPHFTPETKKAFQAAQFGNTINLSELWTRLKWVPMIRLANAVNNRLNSLFKQGEKRSSTIEMANEELSRGQNVKHTVARFDQNRKIADAVCAVYGCKTLHFLQPNPRYQYNLSLYRLKLPESFFSSIKEITMFYDEMRRNKKYIDLSGLFQTWDKNRKAIIDDVHYSPAFNKFLAEHVVASIDLKNLPLFSQPFDKSQATGASRS